MAWTSDADAGLSGALALALIERLDELGRPWVREAGREARPARCLASVSRDALERALQTGAPAVVGRLGDEAVVLGFLSSGETAVAEAVVDGRTVRLRGEEEITLRCGKASITLTKAGKVLIRGEYVLTHAGGVNRVRGGTVEIN